MTPPISVGHSTPLKEEDRGYNDRGQHSVRYIGEKATVGVNEEEKKIATTWPTKSKTVEKLKKAAEDG